MKCFPITKFPRTISYFNRVARFQYNLQTRIELSEEPGVQEWPCSISGEICIFLFLFFRASEAAPNLNGTGIIYLQYRALNIL